MASIQSVSVPLELSSDGGITWKTVVCLTDWTLDLTVDNTVNQSFCGVDVGVSFPTFNGSVNAICETAPITNQLTYKTLAGWVNNLTKISFRIQSPGTGTIGNDFYHEGDCYITKLELKAQVKDTIKFSFDFIGTGVLDITP